MRIVYFGSGAFGLPTFERLAAEHELALVVTQPDRPAGRKRTVTPTPIGIEAAQRGLDIYKPESPNHEESVQRIHDAGADAFVVIAYGHKLSEALLGDYFALNLHASLLPKFRGAAPINWAMIADESHTGVSVITLAQRMDAGAVLGQRRVAIDPFETAGELHDRLAMLGPEAVLDVLDLYQKDQLQPIPQDDSQACKAPKMKKEDGTVSFDQPSNLVRARIHGLTPWPGCTVRLEGEPLKILRARDHAAPVKEEAGTVRDDQSIACGPGSLELLSVQPPGGKAMTFAAYCNGHAIKPGASMTEAFA